MAIIDTKPAAYKGVDFLMLISRIEGGRKDALFAFPNSDKQTIEDLGLLPRAYSMNVIIPHDNYIEQRDRLLRVLEDGEKGPLDHPFYGRVENIVARTFTIVERLSDLGRAELQISFAIDDNIGIPQKSDNAISEASQQLTVLNDFNAANITDDFEVTESFLGNFQDAQELLDNVGEVFTDVVSFATTLTTEINQYAANINEFTTSINQLIAIPQDLANSIKSVFSTIDGLFSSIEATFDAFTNFEFFDFGDDDIEINQTTQGRVQRADNRDTVNQSIQTFALGYAYLNAVQIDFQTVDDIDAANVILEDQYAKIFNTLCLCSETSAALTDLRTIANKLLDDKRVEAKRIITINTKKMPMSVLAYQYYGSTELTDTLLELNAIKGASFVEGDIKILTE